MTLLDMPKTTAMFQWYGAARLVAENVGRELEGCKFVAVPFAGGMCELLYINARTLLVADLHRHAINCARVAADPVLGPKLYRRLRRTAFHPDVLEAAQDRCRMREAAQASGLFTTDEEIDLHDKLDWAYDYFVCAWMARGGTAGTPGEFTGKMSVRLDAGGGDSATRFYSATNGLPLWRRRVLRRCTFQVVSAFDLIPTLKDHEGHGLYIDAPWPDAGDGYSHPFTESQQRRLTGLLERFERTRVVVRFGEHPLIRELYPESRWTWKLQTSRTRTNADCAEALIVRNP